MITYFTIRDAGAFDNLFYYLWRLILQVQASFSQSWVHLLLLITKSIGIRNAKHQTPKAIPH